MKFSSIPIKRFLVLFFAFPVLLIIWTVLLLVIQCISDHTKLMTIWETVFQFWPISVFVLAYQVIILNLQHLYIIDENGISDKTLFSRRKYVLWEDFQYVGPVQQTLRTENMPGGKRGSRYVLICSKKLPYKEFNDDIGYKVAKDSVFIPYTQTNCKILKKWCPKYSDTFF